MKQRLYGRLRGAELELGDAVDAERMAASVRRLAQGGRDDARIAADEVAADEEHDPAVELRVDVAAQRARAPLQLVHVGDELHLAGPERVEVRAALVGRVLAPQELAAELVV